MEKNLILEINRIQKLMGTPVLVLENGGRWGAFIDTLAGKTSVKGYNFFQILETYFKNLDNITDEDIDRVVNEIRKNVSDMTDSEASTLKKLLKEDADFNKVIKGNEDFYTSLKNVSERSLPDYADDLLPIVKKIDIKLTPQAASEFRETLINRLIRQPGNKAYAIYESVKKINLDWFDSIDNLYGKEWMLHNADEVYERIENKLNEYLQNQVKAGNISEDTAKQIFNEVSEDLRTSSPIKNKIDDMIREGRVSGKPKRTTKPKYGDTPYKFEKNNMVDWNQPPKDITKLTADDIPFKKQDKVFDETDPKLADIKVQRLTKLETVFFNHILPWWNIWIERIKNLFNFNPGFEKKKKEFLEAVKRAQDEYARKRANTSDFSQPRLTANYRNVMNKLLLLPKDSNLIVQRYGNVYDLIWDDFVAKGQKELAGNTKGLQEFSDFCIDIQTTNLGRKTASLDEVLSIAKNKGKETFDFGKVMKDNFDEILKGRVPIVNNIKLLSKEWFKDKFWSWFNSGKFKTPRDIQLALSKESGEAFDAVVSKGEVRRTTVFARQRLNREFIKTLFWGMIIATGAVGAVEMLIEGLFQSSTNMELIDRPWQWKREDDDEWYESLGKTVYDYAIAYVAYDFLTGFKIDDYLTPIITGKPADKPDYTEAVWNFLPFGRRDDVIIATIQLFISAIPSDEGVVQLDTLNDMLEKAKRDTKVRDIAPQASDGTDMSNDFKLELLKPSPGSRNPGSQGFSFATGAKMAERLRWDGSKVENVNIYTNIDSPSHPMWIEDLIEDKKYNIVYNQNFQKDRQMFKWDDNGERKTIDELASAFENSFRNKIKTACDQFKNVKFGKNQKKPSYCDMLDKKDIFEQPKKTNNLKSDKRIKINLEHSIYKKRNLIMENTPRTKFGEDNFKHWKDTFVFKAEDEKNPGQFKQVKINMEDVMDRINHYRKKYDEDDAFVRAVLDTHDNVVKVMYTKDLADISESARPRGLALVLRENRGELEIFSVSRPANGNWFLVKGDYTPSQLANMDLEKKEPEDKEPKKLSKTEDDLKKKEEESIILLKRNEKEGLVDLPRKVKQKLKEKISKGWTTEEPPSYLMDFYTTSEVNSVFNDPIEIFKLDPSPSYFATVVKNSARVTPKRGFCRSLYMASRNEELNERQRKTINHILTRCNAKLAGKFGVASF